MMQKILLKAALVVAAVSLFMGVQFSLSAPSAFAQAPDTDADIQITLSEQFIASQVSQQVNALLATQAGLQFQVQNPEVNLQPNNRIGVSASVSMPLWGMMVDLAPVIILSVTAQDNQVSLQIAEVDLEGVALPIQIFSQQLRQAEVMAEQQANIALQQLAAQTNMQLVSISTTDDSLTLGLSLRGQATTAP
jgi:hypothetical protein